MPAQVSCGLRLGGLYLTGLRIYRPVGGRPGRFGTLESKAAIVNTMTMRRREILSRWARQDKVQTMKSTDIMIWPPATLRVSVNKCV